MYAWQFAKYLGLQERMGAARFVSMQNFYNLVYREEEREMLPLCRDQGVGVIPWSRRWRADFWDAAPRRRCEQQSTRAKSDNVLDMEFDGNDIAALRAVETIAAARGVSNAQVAIAWLLARPGVTAPIVGASKPKHLEDAIAAASLRLRDEEVNALEAHYRSKAVAGNLN